MDRCAFARLLGSAERLRQRDPVIADNTDGSRSSALPCCTYADQRPDSVLMPGQRVLLAAAAIVWPRQPRRLKNWISRSCFVAARDAKVPRFRRFPVLGSTSE
jgi:hypothetical protein